MTPKQRFLLTSLAEPHQKLARSEQFAATLDFAMLEMLDRMPRSALEPQSPLAAANYHRLEGAKTYRDLLETLADPKLKPEPPRETIDYRTK